MNKDISELNTSKMVAVRVNDAPTMKVPVITPTKTELLLRLSAIADNLNSNKQFRNDRWGRSTANLAVDALRSSLLQMSYTYQDIDVRHKINEIIAATVDILGV